MINQVVVVYHSILRVREYFSSSPEPQEGPQKAAGARDVAPGVVSLNEEIAKQLCQWSTDELNQAWLLSSRAERKLTFLAHLPYDTLHLPFP